MNRTWSLDCLKASECISVQPINVPFLKIKLCQYLLLKHNKITTIQPRVTRKKNSNSYNININLCSVN